MGGAAVLANLLTRCNGDLSRVLHVYNATCTAAYEREVKKAYYQAMRTATVWHLPQRHQTIAIKPNTGGLKVIEGGRKPA